MSKELGDSLLDKLAEMYDFIEEENRTLFGITIYHRRVVRSHSKPKQENEN